VGDLSDPASLRAAVWCVDGDFRSNPAFAPDKLELNIAKIGAAKSADVKKFVLSGV
jgi:hypothetical protein